MATLSTASAALVPQAPHTVGITNPSLSHTTRQESAQVCPLLPRYRSQLLTLDVNETGIRHVVRVPSSLLRPSARFILDSFPASDRRNLDNLLKETIFGLTRPSWVVS